MTRHQQRWADIKAQKREKRKQILSNIKTKSMREVTLNDVLTSRKLMDMAATNYPKDIFELSKEEYLQKLNIYCDDKGEEQFERFRVQETNRTELLTEFNRAGSGYVGEGNHQKVRTGFAGDGSKRVTL